MPDSAQPENSSDNLTPRILNAGKRVLMVESDALSRLADRLDPAFSQVVQKLDALSREQRHLIVTGIGKSGLIGMKIAATFSSIGLSSVFLHAAEASHGDLGLIREGDTVLALSNSGETEEIVSLLPAITRRKCTLVALTGNPASTLAQRADWVLDVGVQKEACELNLVPTASTTAALAMGDALALALLEMKGFNPDEYANTFAEHHPGGSLGRKLLTTVDDLMHKGDAIPSVKETTGFLDILTEMSNKRLGTTLVVDPSNQVLGIITDGDIRRLLQSNTAPQSVNAGHLVKGMPKTIRRDQMATQALQVMEENKITCLMVTSDGKTAEGVIHLHDVLRAGIA